MMGECLYHAVLKYYVALKEERIILAHGSLGESERVDVVCLVVDGIVDILNLYLALVSVTDVADEIIGLVTDDDNDPSEIKP